MKVAIVHELLTTRGGAERVARVLAGMYPDANIFTLLYDERKLGDWFPRERVRTSRLQPFAKLTKQFNHHLYLPFFRSAVEAWDFSGYDLIVSSSSAFIHGLRVPKGTVHVCYVHAPARYLWDMKDDVLGRMSAPARFCASRLFHRLRTWDSSVADRPTTLVAASAAVQRRIELYWNRQSSVVHPFADDLWFAVPPKPGATPDGPFLIVASLRSYKNIERAIDACRSANVPLSIVGDGSARASLEAYAQANLPTGQADLPTGQAGVRFHGRCEGEQLRGLYRSARALLVPGIEDFGINAVEALACGTPVITVRGGGTVELIDDTVGATCNSTDEDFARTVAQTRLDIDPSVCRTRAECCSRAHFEQQMYSVIEAAISATAKASR